MQTLPEPMISIQQFCDLKLIPLKRSALHKLVRAYPPSQVRRYWLGRKLVVVASELYQDLKRIGYLGTKREE